jgi:hypothetical protein
VFYAFVPPFAPDVAPLASAGRAGDGRLETTVGPDAIGTDGAITWTVTPPRPLSGITLIAGLSGPRLPRSMDLEVSADGQTFERVVRRRRREERRDLRWVNGHPQYVVDDDVVAVALGGRSVAAVRLSPIDTDAWALAEVLVHPTESAGSWGEWLDPNGAWGERRRVLEAHPRPDREDWYARRLLVARHP